MLYIVYCQDKPTHLSKRLESLDAHKAYLEGNPIQVLISGPLVDESDHETMKGSFFLVEADSLEEVRVFNCNDPFYKAGIWQRIDIQPFNKRVDNMSSVSY
ncbi:YciI family protein [Halomonas sp. ATCH28]|uniref:YciI family protein n=1 Tax=Halomonas gemina TaxID=2945105 RepID=A0ABT0T0W6_9GAMM|nr:YciI family protein [Halomonas gemina]MCL7940555.1 YciI family protein [Halomonas gemina]